MTSPLRTNQGGGIALQTTAFSDGPALSILQPSILGFFADR
jgi:hypothetical protein